MLSKREKCPRKRTVPEMVTVTTDGGEEESK